MLNMIVEIWKFWKWVQLLLNGIFLSKNFPTFSINFNETWFVKLKFLNMFWVYATSWSNTKLFEIENWSTPGTKSEVFRFFIKDQIRVKAQKMFLVRESGQEPHIVQRVTV